MYSALSQNEGAQPELAEENLAIEVKPFREINATDLSEQIARDEIASRGYLLVRNALPREPLNRLLEEVTSIIATAGWLLPADNPNKRIANPDAACGTPDPCFMSVYEQIFSLESLHEYAHHPALQHIMRKLTGPRLLIHPKPIVRLIFPNCECFIVQAHQDHQAIGGDSESFTAWMPLHDCPPELGPLQILEGSHRFGFHTPDPTTGCVSKATAPGDHWVGGQINAGDVLIFHSLTVHAASPNLSQQLRISFDCRFQDYARPINPAILVFAGSSNERSWKAIYRNWHSDDLKYFWKQFPLTFKPDKAELEELARTADSPQMRARFARILSQLK
jgi:hypothetical protein